jgi:hypothetical protein
MTNEQILLPVAPHSEGWEFPPIEKYRGIVEAMSALSRQTPTRRGAKQKILQGMCDERATGESRGNGNGNGQTSEHSKAKCNGNFYAYSRHRWEEEGRRETRMQRNGDQRRNFAAQGTPAYARRARHKEEQRQRQVPRHWNTLRSRVLCVVEQLLCKTGSKGSTSGAGP